MSQPIRLTGLTDREVELLNIMWGFEHLEEVEEWMADELSIDERRTAQRLMQMVVAEAYDQEVVADLQQAQEFLAQFRL